MLDRPFDHVDSRTISLVSDDTIFFAPQYRPYVICRMALLDRRPTCAEACRVGRKTAESSAFLGDPALARHVTNVIVDTVEFSLAFIFLARRVFGSWVNGSNRKR
jgi:hypothetical protein